MLLMVSVSYVMTKLVGKWFGWFLTHDGTAMLADNFTKYLNINLGIDFNVNSNFSNEFLD